MPRQERDIKSGLIKDRRAYWQQPWIERVLKGSYNSFEKLLFMRVTSFGKEGCWMTNQTLMEEFGCSESPIRKALTNLWEGGELTITGWNGHGRRIYAARDPKVRESLREWYKKAEHWGKVDSKEDFFRYIRLRGYTDGKQQQAHPVENDGDPRRV